MKENVLKAIMSQTNGLRKEKDDEIDGEEEKGQEEV